MTNVRRLLDRAKRFRDLAKRSALEAVDYWNNKHSPGQKVAVNGEAHITLGLAYVSQFLEPCIMVQKIPTGDDIFDFSLKNIIVRLDKVTPYGE